MDKFKQKLLKGKKGLDGPMSFDITIS